MKTKAAFAVVIALFVTGCAKTDGGRYVQSERGLQAFGRAYIAGVKAGTIKDANAIRVGRALINEWNDANKQLNLARISGDTVTADFWWTRIESILVRVAELESK